MVAVDDTYAPVVEPIVTVAPPIEPQDFTIGSLTVTRTNHAPGGCTFSFIDSDGVQRTVADYSGNVQRMIDTASQPHSASTTQSGNIRKEF